MSKAWVIRDKATGKVLAVHVSNGDTLFRWRQQCEEDGYATTVSHEEIDEIDDGKAGVRSPFKMMLGKAP